MRGVNDIGGLDAGPIDTSAKEPEDWQKTLTALVNVLGPTKRNVLRIDEFRRARESLSREHYMRLPYFDLWTEGLAILIEEKGVLTQAEIEERMAEMRKREA